MPGLSDFGPIAASRNRRKIHRAPDVVQRLERLHDRLTNQPTDRLTD
jgi:hypothetical protein